MAFLVRAKGSIFSRSTFSRQRVTPKCSNNTINQTLLSHVNLAIRIDAVHFDSQETGNIILFLEVKIFFLQLRQDLINVFWARGEQQRIVNINNTDYFLGNEETEVSRR